MEENTHTQMNNKDVKLQPSKYIPLNYYPPSKSKINNNNNDNNSNNDNDNNINNTNSNNN